MIVKFADDMTLLHFIREIAEDSLQQELNNIMAWSDKMHLPVNLLKSFAMNCNMKKSLKIPELPGIATVHATKLLSVTLNEDLKWNIHYDNIIPRAAKCLHMLTQFKAFRTLQNGYRGCTMHISGLSCAADIPLHVTCARVSGRSC
jgi:hypothetical protein